MRSSPLSWASATKAMRLRWSTSISWSSRAGLASFNLPRKRKRQACSDKRLMKAVSRWRSSGRSGRISTGLPSFRVSIQWVPSMAPNGVAEAVWWSAERISDMGGSRWCSVMLIRAGWTATRRSLAGSVLRRVVRVRVDRGQSGQARRHAAIGRCRGAFRAHLTGIKPRWHRSSQAAGMGRIEAAETPPAEIAVNWKNTTDRYGSLSIGMHWLMLLLLVAVYACIELREFYPRGSDLRDGLKTWHFMLGLSVLALVF